MTFSLRSIKPTLCAAIAGVLINSTPLAAEEISDFVPTSTLVEKTSKPLPIQPTKIAIMDQSAYVIGNLNGDNRILQLDGTTLNIVAETAFSFVPDDVIVSTNTMLLYVIGKTQEGQTRISILDDALTELATLRTAVPVAHPTLSLSDDKLLMVAGLSTDEADGVLLAIDVSNPAAPKPADILVPDTYNLFGIADAWLDRSAEDTIFVSTGALPTLLAVGIGEKGIREYADLSFSNASRFEQPLTTVAFMSSDACGVNLERSSFLVASNSNQSLYLVTYDPDFKSLDVLARTEASLLKPDRSINATYDGSDILLPTSLLASSCDMGVVWLGNLNSSEIEQFTVNPVLQSLEKVGEIRLDSPPIGLVVSKTGGAAFAISSRTQSVYSFQSGDGAVLGTAEARTLQRLLTERGFPVGAIDGQIGAKTLSAAERFEERNQVDLNITGNLGNALSIIQSIPSK